MTTKEAIHEFFQNPQTPLARFVEIFIVLLIIVSVGNVAVEFLYPQVWERNLTFFTISEYIILGIFTIEYLLRLLTAPKKRHYATRPMGIIDFLAIAPSYIELLLGPLANTNAIRALRLLKVLRLFKLFRYNTFFSSLLRYQNTILQKIMPILLMLVLMKTGVWVLEYYGLWIQDANLGELFAIIGFALGIILSQKIGVSYDKFIQVEEAAVRIYATLRSLSTILDRVEPNIGTDAAKTWARDFLSLLENPQAANHHIESANEALYSVVERGEDGPAELAVTYTGVANDAAFCLSKKVRLIPAAYDTLLHQATVLYLLMVVVFIPGATGMISIIIATYVLYGMYNLTQDFDSIIGGEFNLIDIDLRELKAFANN